MPHDPASNPRLPALPLHLPRWRPTCWGAPPLPPPFWASSAAAVTRLSLADSEAATMGVWDTPPPTRGGTDGATARQWGQALRGERRL